MLYTIENYKTAEGYEPFIDWLLPLADIKAQAKIATRLHRLTTGNFGDCKPLQSGVWELRLHYGPGYRIYYAQTGKTLLLLLAGGDKSSQQTDIEKAVSYLNDWKRRNA